MLSINIFMAIIVFSVSGNTFIKESSCPINEHLERLPACDSMCEQTESVCQFPKPSQFAGCMCNQNFVRYGAICIHPTLCPNSGNESEVSGSTVSSGTDGSQYGTNESQSGTNASESGMNGSQYGTNESQSGTNGSQYGTNESQSGTNGSQYGTNESQSGTNASESGMNGSQYGTNESQSGTNASQSGSSGSQYGTNESQSGTNASQSGSSGSESGMNGFQSGANGSQSETNETQTATEDQSSVGQTNGEKEPSAVDENQASGMDGSGEIGVGESFFW